MTISTLPLKGLSQIASDYQVLLCDIWGVLHNGIAAWPNAVDALTQARTTGLKVILVSNAPRPNGTVREQLVRLGMPTSAYDDVVTSGDVTRNLFMTTYRDAKVSHIGPEKDKPLVAGLPVTFTSDDQAEVCLCSGLIDDQTEEPEDYRGQLEALASRNIPLICANPDKVVEMGGRLIYCAGALADLYQELGGETIILGKPHAPIYQAALDVAGNPDLSKVLGLGDSMRTDMRGAADQGIDCVFFTGGIHAGEFGPSTAPNGKKVAAFLEQAPYPAKAWMARLSW
ncbi:TIGR01459 family HAD-type hydrolase [Ahrensia marina]|uniref:TIGR01459 family HAD-type hydrolase n=1 Tax=Ahrensia marina TaxID=1514904 RepID=UPI0035CED064